jgi:glycosyltransferase involved in cell wall biosynthesis
MDKPRISIITPSFNQGKYIEQTIDSVLSQNYENLEYIIIDGGSTDNTIDVIRRYERHLAFWVSEPDEGQSHAINKGFKYTTGDVINWLNSDDYYQPYALKFVSEVFSDTSAKVLCARSRKFSDQEEFISKGTDVYKNNLAKTVGWARIDQPETFFRKQAWDVLKGVNQTLHYLMDRDFWIRYLLTFGLDGIIEAEDVIVNFRLHEKSKTVNQSDLFQTDHDAIFMNLARSYQFQDYVELIKSWLTPNQKLTIQYTGFDKNLVYSSLNYFLLHRAHELYFQRNYKVCRELLARVESSLLQSNDESLFRSLKIKSSAFISPLINLLR